MKFTFIKYLREFQQHVFTYEIFMTQSLFWNNY